MKNANLTLRAAFEQQANRIANEVILNKKTGEAAPRGIANADVKSILAWAHAGACDFAEGAIEPAIIAGIKPVKGVKRCAQAVGFIAGDAQRFEPSTAFMVAAILLSQQSEIDYQNMRFIMGGTGDENTAHVKGVSRSRLHRFISSVHEGTRGTRVSSALGANGFLCALGIAQKSGAHSFKILNKNHPFLIAYGARLEAMGDATFALLTEQE